MKLKYLVIFLLLSGTLLTLTSVAYADAVIDNGINFLKTKQNASGNITGGFSSPAQWSAIGFTANGVDINSIKNPTNSLKDFLLTDAPTNNAATDWEVRLLAIIAIGDNPTNFGGVNYLSKLEEFYNTNQIGDVASLNDDIFGLLALIASGSVANPQIKQDTLNFIVTHQDPNGGFSWSPDTTCPFCEPSAEMTAAALQALQVAKENGLTHADLDNAITKAKDYLLTNQHPDGSFGEFGSSDPNSTGWVLMAFNVLGMKDSPQAINAKNWLLTQQSNTDGGFLSMDWSTNTLVSNSTTTAQSLIALAGKGWILRVFTPSVAPTASPTVAATNTTTSSSNSSSTTNPSPSTTSTSVCDEAKPGSAPTLLSAEVKDDNKVKLTWSKAEDPVTYYLLAYGRTPDKLEYGNPDVGGKDTTSYIVGGLSGGNTYYFKVRSGNGCTPGDYSNQLAVTVGGIVTNTSAAGFQERVLGIATPAASILPIKEEQPTEATVIVQSNIEKKSLFFSLAGISFIAAYFYWKIGLKL